MRAQLRGTNYMLDTTAGRNLGAGHYLRGANHVIDPAARCAQCVGRGYRLQTSCRMWLHEANCVGASEVRIRQTVQPKRTGYTTWVWTSPSTSTSATLAHHHTVHLVCAILGPSEVKITIRFLL